MLTNLSIRDIVLVDHLDIEFSGGLSVLTGETGAGKSILLDSLGLAIGARADARLLRHSCEHASVSAVFDIPAKHDVMRLLAEHDVKIENNDKLILRRTLSIDGRSRAFINDQPVSVSFLKVLGEVLVEVHGQFDNQRLLKIETHRLLLDAFAGHETHLHETARAFTMWRNAIERRQKAEADAEAACRDENFIRHAVNELNALDPKPGEEAILAGQRTIMMHGEQLIDALSGAIANISSHNGGESKIQEAVQTLERVAEKAKGQLDEAIGAFDRALDAVAEGIAEVNRFSNSIDLNPTQLEEVEERLFALRGLARKNNIQVDELDALRTRLNEQLASITDNSAVLNSLIQSERTARKDYRQVAKRLSESRNRAAEKLDKKVKDELVGLHLDNACFVTEVEELREEKWFAGGIDQVSFLISTNTGVPPGPIDKIASGGELARFMLALKVVLADSDPVSTIVFDEVDAGVGGAVAAAVGERLRQLGDAGQVLVVTHSPQVAARGNHHWRVSKRAVGDTEEGTNVRTFVHALDPSKREEEIARMLAGRKVTDEARAAADKLLNGTVS